MLNQDACIDGHSHVLVRVIPVSVLGKLSYLNKMCYFCLCRGPISFRFCDFAPSNVHLFDHPTLSLLQVDCYIVEEFREM